MDASVVKMDLRKVPVHERHPRVLDTWDKLAEEATLQITNDFDPKPLRYQFEGAYKDTYAWDYVSKGTTDGWVVNIKKLALPKATGEALLSKVNTALAEVRPHLQADGGNVELVEIQEASGTVRVKLTGACNGCPSAALTLKSGVEATIKKYAHEIKNVEQV
ncbi:MAG: NifU family protein [Deltaproteobacteria bacterium]|nr:NifU family protein [Deltaproteobacteria bacterium]